MNDAAGKAVFFLAAHTYAEFYRGGGKTAREAQLLKQWRPEILTIGAAEGRLAGELLAATRGNNSMDALVVATADLHGITELFSTDPNDLKNCATHGALRPAQSRS